METTQENQPTQADPLAAQLQQATERLGILTVQLAQGRAELAVRECRAKSLAGEIAQRQAFVWEQEQELLRAQGAMGALQQLQQQGGGGE